MLIDFNLASVFISNLRCDAKRKILTGSRVKKSRTPPNIMHRCHWIEQFFLLYSS
jgi:hypothetical protein